MQNFERVLFIPTEGELKKVFNIKAESFEKYFKAGTYRNIPVIVTGIGKANAAMTAATFFSRFSAKTALLTGICGAYSSSALQVGDTVSIKQDYFIDECVFDGEKITTLAEKGMPPIQGNCATFITSKHFPKAISNTVSFIPADEKISELFRIKTNAQVENMEGAAFGMAAAYFGTKLYQIRTISNFCGKLDNQRWNIEKACKNLKKAVDIFLE